MLTPSGSTITLADYNDAILQGAKTHARIMFEESTTTFSDDDISADGGIIISSVINPDDDLVFGKAVAKELRVRFINSSKFDNFAYWTNRCHVDFGVEINGTTRWRLVGYFKGAKPKKTINTDIIEYVAYDRMQEFDKIADEFLETVTYPVTLGQFASNLCTYVGVALNTDWDDRIADAKNYSYTDPIPFKKGITCRQLLAWIAEATGTYAVNRIYDINFIWYTDHTSDYTITADNYYSIDVDEITTPTIENIRVKNSDPDSPSYLYPLDPVGVTYEILDNPFLLSMGGATRDDVCDEILSRFTALGNYSPVSVSAIGNWMVETGDIIGVTYGNNQTIDMPVFNRYFQWDGGCSDSYECTGQAERTELSQSAAAHYQMSGELAEKYSVQSGIDITDEGITVSGGKFVKIQSGGLFDVESSNFTVSSIRNLLKCGQWTLDEDGLRWSTDVPVEERQTGDIITLNLLMDTTNHAFKMSIGYMGGDSRRYIFARDSFRVERNQTGTYFPLTDVGTSSYPFRNAYFSNGYFTNIYADNIHNFVKSGSNASAGLVPSPSTTAGTTKYLREDATWQVPPNTNTWRGYTTKDYTYSWSSLAAGGHLDISANNFGFSTPSGYTPVAVLRANSGNSTYVSMVGFNGKATTTGTAMTLHNTSSSSRSGTANITILYLQTS